MKNKKQKKETGNCEEHCNCSGECNCKENNSVEELQDKYLRLQAEYINFKNRMSVEVGNLLKYEGESLIKEILPIVDNFERAIMMDNDDLSDEVSKFLSGFKMIYTSLVTILENMEVKVIDALGKEFDPVYMDAVLTEHDVEKPENVVLEVLTKGYIYKDKVIRVAMVKVNK